MCVRSVPTATQAGESLRRLRRRTSAAVSHLKESARDKAVDQDEDGEEEQASERVVGDAIRYWQNADKQDEPHQGGQADFPPVPRRTEDSGPTHDAIVLAFSFGAPPFGKTAQRHERTLVPPTVGASGPAGSAGHDRRRRAGIATYCWGTDCRSSRGSGSPKGSSPGTAGSHPRVAVRRLRADAASQL